MASQSTPSAGSSTPDLPRPDLLPPSRPDDELHLADPRIVIDLFRRATDANLTTAARDGALVRLPSRGQLVMTGDLHDHLPNLNRILKFAALHRGPDHFLILHEMIHGPTLINGRDLSIRTLARVAAVIIQYPGQVLLLLSNHELAQFGGEGILKDSISVVEAFDAGVEFLFDDRADEVRAAMNGFIRSMPLAVTCPNGVFCCHSLPSPRRMRSFDATVINRLPTDNDLGPNGSANLMVWGRNHSQQVADELGEAWGAKLFVMGHQPAEMGYEIEGNSMLVLASDHDHGMVLPIDLSRSYGLDDLVGQIVPLAAVVA